MFLHPYKNRRLTVREALRLQSVDDKYVWGPERLSAKFKVIGNGVPVLLAEAVAREVIRIICLSMDKGTALSQTRNRS